MRHRASGIDVPILKRSFELVVYNSPHHIRFSGKETLFRPLREQVRNTGNGERDFFPLRRRDYVEKCRQLHICPIYSPVIERILQWCVVIEDSQPSRGTGPSTKPQPYLRSVRANLNGLIPQLKLGLPLCKLIEH
jgi:hypothetical protein